MDERVGMNGWGEGGVEGEGGRNIVRNDNDNDNDDGRSDCACD